MRNRLLAVLGLAAMLGSAAASPAFAAPKTSFKIAWSIYVGWMPWQWAADHGIVKKWADKYGITIDLVQVNDYVESINQYTAGAFDGVTVTNMDALAIPCVGGVDTSAIIMGDFSNGNDAIILKARDKLADIKGQKINLVQFSVSHYLLVRALNKIGLTERDVSVVNTSDADIVAAYGTPSVTSVVTWNPLVSTIMEDKTAREVFNSSQIPGEIMDLVVVNTKTLHDNPKLGKALAGIWYDVLATTVADTAAGRAARTDMGKASGTDLAGFEAQLKTTRLFVTPAEAVGFTRSAAVPKTMRLVRDFLFTHGLMGEGTTSPDVIGIEYPDHSVLGNPKKVTFRFDPSFMAEAAAGKL